MRVSIAATFAAGFRVRVRVRVRIRIRVRDSWVGEGTQAVEAPAASCEPWIGLGLGSWLGLG